MAQAGPSILTRRAFTNSLIASSAMVAAPTSAANNPTPICTMWDERHALLYDHAVSSRTLELAGYVPDDDPRELAVQRTFNALWDHDDLLMSLPSTDVTDLAIKAHITKVRSVDEAHEPYLRLLLDDLIEYARANARGYDVDSTLALLWEQTR